MIRGTFEYMVDLRDSSVDSQKETKITQRLTLVNQLLN